MTCGSHSSGHLLLTKKEVDCCSGQFPRSFFRHLCIGRSKRSALIEVLQLHSLAIEPSPYDVTFFASICALHNYPQIPTPFPRPLPTNSTTSHTLLGNIPPTGPAWLPNYRPVTSTLPPAILDPLYPQIPRLCTTRPDSPPSRFSRMIYNNQESGR